jgi:cytochrome c oxidase subunit 1
VKSYRAGLPAGDNPWGASTLEWATSSPPPACNFVKQPVVQGREPLWENAGAPRYVTGLADDAREVLITRVVDAAPDHRDHFPDPTIWPFASAILTTILFVASIFTPWAVVWGTIPVAIALTLWFWPHQDETRKHLELEKRPA